MGKFLKGDIVRRTKVDLFTGEIKTDDVCKVFGVSTSEGWILLEGKSGEYREANFELVIPRKWSILRTKDNHKIINQWCNSNEKLIDRNTFTDDTYFIDYDGIGVPKMVFAPSYPLITFEDFKKYVLKQEIEPIIQKKERKLSIQNYRRIHKIACPEWKVRLQNKYGKNFAISDEIIVSYDDYKQMRIACTEPQHKLFDEIFGKDEPNIPKGTPCLVSINVVNSEWCLRYSDGNGEFTIDKNNQHFCNITWKYVHPIPEILNNLPQN